MATNMNSIMSMEACNELLKEILKISPEYLPKRIYDAIKRIEKGYDGSGMTGHRWIFSLHIGQQKRQIAWTDKREHLHKSIKVK